MYYYLEDENGNVIMFGNVKLGDDWKETNKKIVHGSDLKLYFFDELPEGVEVLNVDFPEDFKEEA